MYSGWDSKSNDIKENKYYKSKFKSIVANEPQLNKNQFKQKMGITNNLTHYGNLSGNQWWNLYQRYKTQEIYNQTHGLINTEDNLNYITGFRSKNKNEYLGIIPQHRKLNKNIFPKKKNRKFITHLVYPLGTYFIDIMFSGPKNEKMYLLCLNFHSRYLYFREIYSKLDREVSTKLNQILPFDCKYLRGDSEGAFLSRTFNRMILEPRGITFIPVDREHLTNGQTAIVHDKMSVIDRITRTLRDQAYVAGFSEPLSYKVMYRLIDVYNHAPHTFLSHFANRQVSPNDVNNNFGLLMSIWRKVQQDNFNISRKEGFILPIGTQVSVYYQTDKFTKRRTQVRPEFFTVVGFEKGQYILQDEKGKLVRYSRFRINPN